MAILIEALSNPDGSNYRLFYVLGAMLGLGLFALTDWLAWDSVRAAPIEMTKIYPALVKKLT